MRQIKVFGDIMLDEWVYGNLSKYSVEAPIKIFTTNKLDYSLGGVGNLAANLKSLNINLKLFSSIGSDDYGNKIKEILLKKKINFQLFHRSQTTLKRRYFIKKQNLFRNDVEKFEKENNFEKINLKNNEIVIISDYQKGFVTKNFHKYLMQKNIITMIDPKNKPEFYKKAFLVKPNLKKFEEWCGSLSYSKAFALLKKMKWTWLVITCGSRGVHVFNKYGLHNHYKVKKVEKPNIVGAGDIFFASLISCYINNNDIFTSCELASYATSKIIHRSNKRLVKKENFKKDRVFTNGVFDILHKGHKDILKFSRKIGDRLIVGINSDLSVKKNKGKNRPYNDLNTRINNLKKLKFIDQIIPFKEKTPINLIRKLKPDVIIKGNDYKFKEIAGRNISNIILYEKKTDISSTTLIKKTKKNY